MRLTKHVLAILNRAAEMEHAGGFYTANHGDYLRCERLRDAGLLKFWNGRRSRFWSSQFFTITDNGRVARTEARCR